MIQVGINENVVLEKVEITDAEKGTLAFTFRGLGDPEKEKLSAFEALAADGYTDTGDDQMTIRLFSPNVPFDKKNDGTPISLADQQDAATDNIAAVKNILFQILTVYMTAADAKLDLYKGTGLDAVNFPTRILQEATLQKIMVNMATDFVAKITPFLDDDKYAVRLLLVRQSKTKHFATFRSKFVKDNPFIESMAIPKEASKLAFTKYESTNGLNDGSPVPQSAADATAEKAEELRAESVFGPQ